MKKTLSEMADGCTGENSLTLRTGERYCTLLIPDFNGDRAECVHAVRTQIRDIGGGTIQKLQKIYLCDYE